MQTMTDPRTDSATSAPLLTVKQVAALLGVNDYTVREWIREGKLEAIVLGSRTGYRIEQAALDRFLDERRTRKVPRED